jgi:hypothetical protein
MLLFTLHGLFYVIAWTIEGNLKEVSANGVVLFLLYSHIYTYVFYLFHIYLFVCLFAINAFIITEIE